MCSPKLLDGSQYAWGALTIVIVVLFSLCAADAQAQDTVTGDSAVTASRGWWISLGAGSGTQGPAGNAMLTFRLNQYLITLRVAGTDNGSFFGPSEAIRDFAFPYGRRVPSTPDWLLVFSEASQLPFSLDICADVPTILSPISHLHRTVPCSESLLSTF